MPYDDYAAQRTASLLDRISKDKTITSTNKKAVNDFLNFMRAKGLKPATLHKNLYCLVSYLKILGHIRNTKHYRYLPYACFAIYGYMRRIACQVYICNSHI